MNKIDYALISQAIGYYEQQGFQYIEVPWVVDDHAVNLTLPTGHTAMRCMDGPLVGSAEQSFFYMAREGRLPAGRYVAASPCFRDDKVDAWHQRTFFKVELIDLVEQDMGWPGCFGADAMLEREMAEIALAFFQRFEPSAIIERVPGPNVSDRGHLDITLGGVELGSYGERASLGWSWTYGTGLAEPRFSMARNALIRQP
jgi:hypothetical protein